MEWNGAEWNGMEWNGELRRVRRARRGRLRVGEWCAEREPEPAQEPEAWKRELWQVRCAHGR
jgi:hypothetical protein